MERVQKILSNAGFCSRRKAEELIGQGRVCVNSKKISLGDKASENDVITIDGKRLKKSRKSYYLFHKPKGCVTALTDKRLKTIMDFVRIKERVYPVGRLDYNTSGLLILTNDGEFANSIMHPRYEIRKSYIVELNKAISDKKLGALKKGVAIDSRVVKPDNIRVLNPRKLEIVIHEGRNRIIRRVFEKLGLSVINLKRTRIGNIRLGDIKPGEYVRLKRKPEICPESSKTRN